MTPPLFIQSVDESLKIICDQFYRHILVIDKNNLIVVCIKTNQIAVVINCKRNILVSQFIFIPIKDLPYCFSIFFIEGKKRFQFTLFNLVCIKNLFTRSATVVGNNTFPKRITKCFFTFVMVLINCVIHFAGR